MNPFSLAIPFGLISPALAVGGFAYFWRSLLPHFWWFIGIGAVASYVLMAMCLTWALSDVGITGNLSATPKPALDPITIRYLSFMLGWLMVSAIILYLTRYLLSKV
jgi:glucan phosphoethanolaminetransferase (alkaline phosphatase superfamily)